MSRCTDIYGHRYADIHTGVNRYADNMITDHTIHLWTHRCTDKTVIETNDQMHRHSDTDTTQRQTHGYTDPNTNVQTQKSHRHAQIYRHRHPDTGRCRQVDTNPRTSSPHPGGLALLPCSVGVRTVSETVESQCISNRNPKKGQSLAQTVR